MITVYTGLPGSGKTVQIARQAEKLARKNLELLKSTGVARYVRSNLPFSPIFVKKYGEILRPFSDIYDMPKWKECDVVIDELADYFDSHEWERTPREIKAYLRLHRHYKVNIYAVAQDFLTVDKSFRRLCAHLYHIDRIFSYGEPSVYKSKNKKHPFVFSVIREVDPNMWELEKEYYTYIPATSSYELFTKRDFIIYDTFADLPPQPLPPLKLEVRHWYDDQGNIGYTRKRYI